MLYAFILLVFEEIYGDRLLDALINTLVILNWHLNQMFRK